MILRLPPARTSPPGHKLTFRTIGLDSLQGPTAGKFIAERVKPTVAVVR